MIEGMLNVKHEDFSKKPDNSESNKMYEDLKIARSVKLLDLYLCKYLHNPVFWGSLTIITSLAINFSQLLSVRESSHMSSMFLDDYVLDLIQNGISFFFIYRFGFSQFFGIQGELALFALINLGLIKLLCDERASLLYSNINSAIKICVWWQVISPYAILSSNIYCYFKNKRKNSIQSKNIDIEKGELVSHEDRETDFCLRRMILYSNNDFLPIFISHSFACINFNFLPGTNAILIILYKISVLMLKFYCVYKYLLYEVVHAVYEISDSEDYKSLYSKESDAEIGQKWRENLLSDTFISKFFIFSVTICALFDVIYILLAKDGII